MGRLCVVAACCIMLGLFVAGCGSQAERNEMRDDLTRFRQQRAAEFTRMQQDIARFVREHDLNGRELPIDIDHFLEWRRREWWHLSESLAAAYVYEWDNVARLADGAARCYGVELRNFPRVGDDVLRFFEHADLEYQHLVMDVVAFIEVQHRELLPLRAELKDAYARVGWEAANLQLEVRDFLSWREREWNKLRRDAGTVMAEERVLGQKLRDDLRRFRAARAIEGRLLVADLKAWWRYENEAMPARLIDDLYRWESLPAHELNKLRDDVARFGEGIAEDAAKLAIDGDRYARAQLDQAPLLAYEVDRFFEDHKREIARLDDGVHRFWTSNVSLGILSMEDMHVFFIEHTGEEAAELQASLRRFVAYSRKEWRDFRAAWARFLYDDSGRAFGDKGLPMAGGTGGPGGEDDPRAFPARGYDAGRE